MTLDRHRSKLIPDVDFGVDGHLFVTDRQGTFPLSANRGPKERLPPKDYDPEDIKSYRSYDQRRESKKPRYRQNNRYEKEIAAMQSGTWSTATSSLARKVRRTHSMGGKKRPISEAGSMRGRPARGGIPRMTPEFTETIERGHKMRKSLDIEAIRRTSKKGEKNYFGRVGSDYQSSNGNAPLLLWDSPTKNRKITEERLPGVIFIVTGIFLIVLGILRIFLSYWHECFCALWTGIFVSVNFSLISR